MAAFIIFIAVLLPCVVGKLICADWQAIEEENKRYYTEKDTISIMTASWLRHLRKREVKSKISSRRRKIIINRGLAPTTKIHNK